jgi:hypothetical protein
MMASSEPPSRAEHGNVHAPHPLTLAGIVLVLAASAVAWIAIGRLGRDTEQALAQTEIALTTAVDIADATAATATDLRVTLQLISGGLQDTSDALVATKSVSANVRNLVGSISFINSVEKLETSLKEAEASIEEVRTALAATSGQIDDTLPNIVQAVRALEQAPNDIRSSVAEVARAREQIAPQRRLWRIAVLFLAAALVALFLRTETLGRRADQP